MRQSLLKYTSPQDTSSSFESAFAMLFYVIITSALRGGHDMQSNMACGLVRQVVENRRSDEGIVSKQGMKRNNESKQESLQPAMTMER